MSQDDPVEASLIEPPVEPHAAVVGDEPRNMLVLGLYDVVIRIGWIFKTESVIMPAFLDAVAGAGWLRGLLPVVNRFGQSVPPALYASHLQRQPRKRGALAGWTLAMAATFLALAAVWWWVGSDPPSWMATAFLILYALFSSSHGINQLAYGTTYGKLIRPGSRGRLLGWTLPLGSGLAVLFAAWLMGDWLREPDGGFVAIFAFTGGTFTLAAMLTGWLREPADHAPPRGRTSSRAFVGAWQVLREDRNFRRFGIVVALSATTTILFPHYQALARERLGLANENLMIWVVVQNLAMGGFGWILGRIVHHSGERLAVRFTMFGAALAPLLAVVLVNLERETAREWFWLVFIAIGMSPLMQKSTLGYTLEASPAHDHARYLSTQSLCMACPFLLSPLVGACVDRIGFEWVFLTGSVLLVLAGLLTYRLDEPRHAEQHGTPAS